MEKQIITSLPTNIMEQLKDNQTYNQMLQYQSFRDGIIKVYNMITTKFELEDHLKILSYYIDKVQTGGYHIKEISGITNYFCDFISNINPKDLSFYYIYALELINPSDNYIYKDHIIIDLNYLFKQASFIRKQACDTPFQFSLQKDKLKQKIDGYFLKYDSKMFDNLHQSEDISELLNSATDDIIKYIYKYIELAKNGETYCNECGNQYCLSAKRKR